MTMNGKRGNQGTTEDEAYTEARNQATEVEFQQLLDLIRKKEREGREFHIHATTLMLSISPSQNRLRRSQLHIYT